VKKLLEKGKKQKKKSGSPSPAIIIGLAANNGHLSHLLRATSAALLSHPQYQKIVI
jgi:poly-beta-hydroxyalkanoate depolymerase